MNRLLTCPKCQNRVEATDFFCRVCGHDLASQPLATSFPKQISVYLVSFFLPPFGLVPAIKYLRQNDQKSKRVGIVAIILTLLSLLLSIRLLSNMIEKFTAISTGQLNNFENLGY